MMMMTFVSRPLPPSVPRNHVVRPPIICGRKPRRRPKNPSPPQTRPLPTLPPLPEPTALPPPQLLQRAPCASSRSLIKTLQSRHDAIVLNPSPNTPIIAALHSRENSEHALILLPTRISATNLAALLSDPSNRPFHSRKTRVILATGNALGSWKHPAMNANSSSHSVIVVGTPRAMHHQFFNSHGLPWLAKVRFLIVAGVAEMLENGAGRELHKVVRRIGVKRKTVIVEEVFNDVVEKFSDGWVRPKHKVIEWGSAVSKAGQAVAEGCVVTAGPKEGLEFLVRVVDECKPWEQIVVLFSAARVAEIYATMLRVLGRQVVDIHSKTSTGNRARGLELFKTGGVLLGTDTVLDEVEKVDVIVSVGVVEEGVYRKRMEVGKRGIVLVRPEVSGVVEFVGAVQEWEGGGNVNWEDVRNGVGEKARRVAYQSLVTVYGGWRRRLEWNRPQVVGFVNDWAKELFGETPEVGRKFAGRKRLMGYKDVRVKRKQVGQVVAS